MQLDVINPHALRRKANGQPAAPMPAPTRPSALNGARAQAEQPLPVPTSLSLANPLKALFGNYDPMTTRQVERDPADVNHPDPGEVDAASRATSANRAAEQDAVGQLSAGDRDQYDAVLKLAQGDVMARRALQQMLLEGKLPGERPLVGDGTLLSQLYGLTQQNLAPGIDRATLVQDVVAEVQDPVRIDQQAKGTCAATTAQILLVRRHPAEYVRLVGGLASPDGQVTMKGGAVLKRDGDWADGNDGDRTVSSRLFQPAAMNAAQSLPGESYRNGSDRSYLGPIPLKGGLTAGGSAHLNSELEGVSYDNVQFLFGNRLPTFQRIVDAIAAGRGSVPVSLAWNADGAKGGHEVQVDKVQDGRVYYTNPWGQQESMAESEFVLHLTAASIPTA